MIRKSLISKILSIFFFFAEITDNDRLSLQQKINKWKDIKRVIFDNVLFDGSLGLCVFLLINIVGKCGIL
jgi:hypothetical protein